MDKKNIIETKREAELFLLGLYYGSDDLAIFDLEEIPSMINREYPCTIKELTGVDFI